MTFISDTFISNTGWDLIQNNNNLRYHKGLKKNQYNCIGPPTFKNIRYRMGRQSNQKLLHHYQPAKDQLSSSIQSEDTADFTVS